MQLTQLVFSKAHLCKIMRHSVVSLVHRISFLKRNDSLSRKFRELDTHTTSVAGSSVENLLLDAIHVTEVFKVWWIFGKHFDQGAS